MQDQYVELDSVFLSVRSKQEKVIAQADRWGLVKVTFADEELPPLFTCISHMTALAVSDPSSDGSMDLVYLAAADSKNHISIYVYSHVGWKQYAVRGWCRSAWQGCELSWTESNPPRLRMELPRGDWYLYALKRRGWLWNRQWLWEPKQTLQSLPAIE